MLILPHHSPLGKLRPREIKVHNWLSAIRQAGDEVATCIFGSPVESTDVSEPRLHEAAVQANAPLLATQDIDAVMRRTCVGLAGSVTELLAGPSGHLATFELGNEIDGHVTGRCCAPADRFLTYVDVKCAVGVHFVTVMRRIADVIVIAIIENAELISDLACRSIEPRNFQDSTLEVVGPPPTWLELIAQPEQTALGVVLRNARITTHTPSNHVNETVEWVFRDLARCAARYRREQRNQPAGTAVVAMPRSTTWERGHVD